jgi:hypothetical protein
VKKEIGEDARKWKDLPCSCSRINIVKMIVLLKAVHRFIAILTKVPVSFFRKIETSMLKFIWEHKRPQIAKVILSKKSKYLTSNYTSEQ